MTDYTLRDVRQLEADITKLLPEAMFSHTDYGWALTAALKDGEHTHWVTACQPQRDDRGRTGYIITAKEVVSQLKGMRDGHVQDQA